MSEIEIKQVGDVFVLTMKGSPKGKDFENRMTWDFMKELSSTLKKIAKDHEGKPCAIVTTSIGKFYSQGLHLDTLMSLESNEKRREYMSTFYDLLHTVITLPIPTVAAIQGHAFAGGFLLSIAHDYRVMNEEKGFLCLNELELGFDLTRPLNALVRDKLPRDLGARMVCEAIRINAKQSVAEKICITSAKGETAVVDEAIKIAQNLAKNAKSPALGIIKTDIYCEASDALNAASSFSRSRL